MTLIAGLLFAFALAGVSAVLEAREIARRTTDLKHAPLALGRAVVTLAFLGAVKMLLGPSTLQLLACVPAVMGAFATVHRRTLNGLRVPPRHRHYLAPGNAYDRMFLRATSGILGLNAKVRNWHRGYFRGDLVVIGQVHAAGRMAYRFEGCCMAVGCLAYIWASM
jgi:hypothetical protein